MLALTRKSKTFALMAVCILLLQACGFSLRGSDVIASRYSSLGLNLQQPNSEFAQLLRRSLVNADVEINETDPAQLAGDLPILSVSAEQLTVEPVTVTPLARAAQYEILMSVTVSMARGTENLFGPEELFMNRVYFENTDNLTGTMEEVQVIQSEMRRDLVNQVLRRMEAVNPVALAN